MEYEHWITPPMPGGARFRWQGVIDFGELYRYMKWWLEDNGFCNENGFTVGEVCMEKKFIERRFQGGVKNVEVEWKASIEKNVYFKYNIHLTILILGMKDEEVEIKGVKRKLDRGDYDMRMGANVETEYREDWNKFSFRKIYYNFFIKRNMSMHKRNLYILFYRFNSAIKDYVKNARY